MKEANIENFELWLSGVQDLITNHYKTNYKNLEVPVLTYTIGKRYIKIINPGSVWGFVSLYNGNYKGVPITTGDLLKPASWASPAKHSRGNIFNGTASYDTYGPNYLT